MEPKEICILQLKACQENYKDFEAAHMKADKALVDFLIRLGHQDVIDEYLKVKRYFS